MSDHRRPSLSWQTALDPANPLRVHVLPVEDLMPHNPRWTDCNCGPRLDAGADEYGTVIVHHSLDGREHADF